MANDPQTEALRRQHISETKRQKSGRSLTDEQPQPCACGCGELTTVAKNTGKARKWRPGHMHRLPLADPGVLPLREFQRQKCRACGRILPLTEFYLRSPAHLGVQSACKKCVRAEMNARRDADPEKYLDAHLRRKFGITLAQYNGMLGEQGGICAICGEPPTIENSVRMTKPRSGKPATPRLYVDHDHVTGRVRGLLCQRCNVGIGFLKDDAAIVRFALKYLEERG